MLQMQYLLPLSIAYAFTLLSGLISRNHHHDFVVLNTLNFDRILATALMNKEQQRCLRRAWIAWIATTAYDYKEARP